MKRCNHCDQELPLDAFSPLRSNRDGRHGTCKACRNTEARQAYATNATPFKKRARKHSTRTRYGITDDDYRAMLRAQNFTCKICGDPAGKRALHVDHDHTTGTVRGLLCGRCNTGLGMFRDRPIVLYAAAEYLEAARCTN